MDDEFDLIVTRVGELILIRPEDSKQAIAMSVEDAVKLVRDLQQAIKGDAQT